MARLEYKQGLSFQVGLGLPLQQKAYRFNHVGVRVLPRTVRVGVTNRLAVLVDSDMDHD